MTCVGVLTQAAAFHTSVGITKIERVIADRALAYRNTRAFTEILAQLGGPLSE